MKTLFRRFLTVSLLAFSCALFVPAPPARAQEVSAPANLELGGTNGVLYRLWATNTPVYQNTIDLTRVEKLWIGLSQRWMTNTVLTNGVACLYSYWRWAWLPDGSTRAVAGASNAYNFQITFPAATTNVDWYWFQWDPPFPAGALMLTNIYTPHIWGTNAGGEYLCVSNVAVKYIKQFSPY